MKTKRTRKRRIDRSRRSRPWFCVDILIEYKGLDFAKDDAIRRALGKWSEGSGFLFGDISGVRDHTASVPPDKLAAVVAKLKKIRGLTIKKLIKKWVRIR